MFDSYSKRNSSLFVGIICLCIGGTVFGILHVLSWVKLLSSCPPFSFPFILLPILVQVFVIEN